MDAKGLAVVVDGLPGVALVRQRVGQVGVPLLVLRVQADSPREVGNGLLDSALSQQHGAQGVVGGEGVGVQAQRFLQEAMGFLKPPLLQAQVGQVAASLSAVRRDLEGLFIVAAGFLQPAVHGQNHRQAVVGVERLGVGLHPLPAKGLIISIIGAPGDGLGGHHQQHRHGQARPEPGPSLLLAVGENPGQQKERAQRGQKHVALGKRGLLVQ